MISRQLQKTGWVFYCAFLAFLVAIPFVVELPLPEDAIKIVDVELISPDGSATAISLPHRWKTNKSNAGVAVYNVAFDLAEMPSSPLYLFVPDLKRRLEVTLQGEVIFDSSVRVSWSGPLVPIAGLLQFPTQYLHTGTNSIVLTLHGEPTIPAYLSELYIGPKESVLSSFKVRMFFNERVMMMAYAIQLFLSVGMLVAFLYRRSDKVYGWFFLIIGLSSFFGVSIRAKSSIVNK